MGQEHITIYPIQTEPRNKICDLSFELAYSMFDKSNPSRYTIERQEEGELHETIALIDPDSTQEMLLRRYVGEGGVAN